MGTYVRTQSIDQAVGERGTVSLTVHSADVRARGIARGEAHARATFEISASSDADADRIYEAFKLHVTSGSGELSVDEHDSPHSFGTVIGRLFRHACRYELSVEAEIRVSAQLS